MKTSEILDLFRKETDDVMEPYLWSDEEILAYLNEAQEVHVRLTGGIADRRSPLTKLTYKTGDQFRKYSDRILRIQGAWDENNNKVTVQNYDSLETGYLEDDYGRRINAGLDDTRTGPIKYMITDVDAGDIQLYPIPDHDGYIRMYIRRLPREEITSTGSELEISSYHHMNLLNWVKYKAYMKQDAETFDGAKARDFRMAFVDGLENARKDKAAREDRKRVVQYGGIPMS